MPTPASFEQAYSQGVVEGSRLNHYRVQKMKYALGATVAFAVVGFGFAWQHVPASAARPEVVVVTPSSLVDASTLACPKD